MYLDPEETITVKNKKGKQGKTFKLSEIDLKQHPIILKDGDEVGVRLEAEAGEDDWQTEEDKRLEQEFKDGGGHLKEVNPTHNKKKGYDNYGITNMAAYLEGADTPVLIPKNSIEENEAIAKALAESEQEATSQAKTVASGEGETQATTATAGTPGEEQKDTELKPIGAGGATSAGVEIEQADASTAEKKD